MTALAGALDLVLLALLLHTAVNVSLLRRPPVAGPVREPVSVLVPMRDEADRAERCVQSLLAQRHLDAGEIVVYDDGSTDGTADVVRTTAARAGGGDRVTVVGATPPPAGALGKPWACSRLAAVATGSVLVFVDADVVLAPDAVARAVLLLRAHGLQWVAPYPRQLAGTWAERLVQPLLQWSWLTFLPLRVAERSRRPSTATANGQFLVVDAAAYHRCGGHARVRGDVLDDVALARTLRAAGGRGGFVDGTELAQCRMYAGGRDLAAGYAKSLWRAFGSPLGAVAVAAVMLALYVLPWVLAIRTAWALPAAVAGPAGRMLTAVRTRGRVLPDPLAHPLSVLAFAGLTAYSLVAHRRGTLRWKGRPVR